jgi:hypothetical protein
MPFVFADPGTSHESLGKKMFQGREYDAVKITYKPGTGDSSDDFYVAYLEADSGQLKLSSYVVTYPALRKGKPIAIVFEEWQEIEGLTVPRVAQYYAWKNDNIDGEPLGKMSFDNVHFSSQTPPAGMFEKPAEAVVAPLE